MTGGVDIQCARVDTCDECTQRDTCCLMMQLAIEITSNAAWTWTRRGERTT